jgi:hypothetical protein
MSNQNNDRKFVGNGVKANGYDLVNISIAKSKLEPYWYEYNGEHYIKLTVGAKKGTDQYGKTHTVWINDYVPANETKQEKSNSNVVETDMPF